MSNTSYQLGNESLQQLNDRLALQLLPEMIVLGIIALVGFIGNSLVLFVYVFQFPTSTTKCFILALALLDLLNCVIGIPLNILWRRYYFSLSLCLCKVEFVIKNVSVMGSASILLIVAVDRYRKICRPLQNQMTPRTALMTCCVVTTLILLFTVVEVCFYEQYPSKQSISVTVSLCRMDKEDMLIFIAIKILIFVAVLVSLVVLYSLIWHRILRRNNIRRATSRPLPPKNRSELPSDLNELTLMRNSLDVDSIKTEHTIVRNQDVSSTTGGDVVVRITTIERQHVKKSAKLKQKGREVRRLTLILFLITIVFIVSFLPYLVLTTMALQNVFHNLSKEVVRLLVVLQSSYCIQSMANPIIYSFFSKNFQKETKRLFRKKMCPN